MNSPDPNPDPDTDPDPDLATASLRTVVCVGDVHGYFAKLHALWANLESSIPPRDFRTALVIFLGDYCDHGPDTRRVIDFFLSLPSAYPRQTRVFLAGNHDFAFAAFVGAIPGSVEAFREGWKAYGPCEESEGWYRGEGYEEMHLQGRRCAGKMKDRFKKAKGKEFKGSIFNAAPTFESYGVAHGSAVTRLGSRDDLVKTVPEEHKKFLAGMVLVHEEDDVCIATPEGIKHCRLIAVHAGLERGKDVGEQLRLLQAKDTRIAKIQAIAVRKNVWDIPEELIETPTIVVSGHHGKLHIQGLRLIIDEGNGSPDKPVVAVVLLSLKIIRDTDFLPTE